jgi:hypothetical protein
MGLVPLLHFLLPQGEENRGKGLPQGEENEGKLLHRGVGFIDESAGSV